MGFDGRGEGKLVRLGCGVKGLLSILEVNTTVL